MIWILATRGAATKLRASPFTETAIAGVHSVVYKPGVELLPFDGTDPGVGALGTFGQGLHRMLGLVFSYDGAAAETLFAVSSPIDLIIRYRANGQKRKRTLTNILFGGDAMVAVPSLNEGVSEPIGVPFRVQIAGGETVSSHVIDELEA